jgi:hypothetical protein
MNFFPGLAGMQAGPKVFPSQLIEEHQQIISIVNFQAAGRSLIFFSAENGRN